MLCAYLQLRVDFLLGDPRGFGGGLLQTSRKASHKALRDILSVTVSGINLPFLEIYK